MINNGAAVEKRSILMTAILMSLLLGGCGKENSNDVAVDLLKKSLKSPESFSLIGEKVAWSGKTAAGDEALIYRIEYRARDDLDREQMVCSFVAVYKSNGDYVGAKAMDVFDCTTVLNPWEEQTLSAIKNNMITQD